MWPTPTPRPDIEATSPINFPDPNDLWVGIAEDGVQWWNHLSQITDIMILTVVIIIILGGMYMVMKQVRTL